MRALTILLALARVHIGAEVWIDSHFGALRGGKVALVTNHTGVLPDLRHLADVLAASKQIRLCALLAPEHGFRGAAQAGHSDGTTVDARTKLPVYGTYGKSGRELADVLARTGADAFVVDLQDVGARYYTYIWTLYDVMEAAALAGKRVVVLDRPNPIGGLIVQGPVLEPAFASFVGRQPIALRHGMTIGELARLFNGEFLGGRVELEVVPMTGWSRQMSYADTGLPWVPPSPNMPTVDTAYAFAGMALLEGTNLSEGRGTTRPFEILGAPFIDHRFADALNALRLPGVAFRETWFRPTFDKWRDQTCGGVQVHVTERAAFDPIATAVAVLVTARRLYPAFEWRREWIDRMWGSDRLRTQVDAGLRARAIVERERAGLARFVAVRRRYLLYPEGLRYGSAAEAGLVGWALARLDADVARAVEHRAFPGAVALVGKDGVIVHHAAFGNAVEHEAPEQPMRKDSIFDLASLSKLFTSIAVMQLVERGKIDLDAPVARYLPDFGKPEVRVRQLLTHTAGLPAWLPLFQTYRTREERLAAVLAVAPVAAPGTKFLYSDLGLITAGLLVEKVSGQPLDRYVAAHITGPLGMKDTGYRPAAELRARIAATEVEPGRGLVWGSVHDENAWSLGGVAGHAGVFSTAYDLALLCQAIVDGGGPILRPETVREMVRNQNPGIPDGEHGLGFDLDARFYMGALAGPQSIGHTGFTGTSLVIDLSRRTFVILLTNAVHPRRGRKINTERRQVADDVALADPATLAGYLSSF